MIRITAPNGKKLRDLRTNCLHSEAVTDERNRKFFVIVDSDGDLLTEAMSGLTAEESDYIEAAKILLGEEE